MRPLENRFTWSKSRAETFRHCLRKYWWTYYGAWGGWAREAPPEAREAYMLKNLHSRWTWVGQVVHSTIERILVDILKERRCATLPLGGANGLDLDVAAVVEGVTDEMRVQFRASRDGLYRADPKRVPGLVEHEYAEPVPDAEWKEMNRRAKEGVSRFLASPVFERIRASDPRTWFPIEKLDSFDFEGVPVWVALDFAMRTPEGAEVFDWKTGSDKSDRNDGNRLQVLGYALYLAAKENVPAERVVCRLVYVNTGTVLEMRPTAADLDTARAEIRESMAQMRRRLRDPSTNSADMLAFPMTDDLSKCSGCSFRRLCNR